MKFENIYRSFLSFISRSAQSKSNVRQLFLYSIWLFYATYALKSRGSKDFCYFSFENIPVCLLIHSIFPFRSHTSLGRLWLTTLDLKHRYNVILLIALNAMNQIYYLDANVWHKSSRDSFKICPNCLTWVWFLFFKLFLYLKQPSYPFHVTHSLSKLLYPPIFHTIFWIFYAVFVPLKQKSYSQKCLFWPILDDTGKDIQFSIKWIFSE